MSTHVKKQFGWLAFVLGVFIVTLLSFSFPQPVQSQFTGQRTWGGTSSGSANAQTIAVPNYNLDVGVSITFKAGFSNTASTTFSVNGTSATIALRPTTTVGMRILVGGEIIAGQLVTIVYDGTNYQIQMPPVDVGRSEVWRLGSGVPVGWQVEDGSCPSKTDPLFTAVFAAIGDTYTSTDGCTTGAFGIPDQRGRMFGALDSQGLNGPANRITVAGSGCLGTTQAGCGLQTSTLNSVNQFPSYQPQGSVTQVTATGTVATTINNQGDLGGVYVPASAAPDGFSVAAGKVRIQSLSATSTFTGTNGGTGVFTGTTVGASAPIVTLSPVLLAFSAIKL